MKIRNLLLSALFLSLVFPVVAQKNNVPDNTLSKTEIKEGWVLLFDGKSLNGWKAVKTGRQVESGTGWSVSGGVLALDPESTKGDIVTARKYRNFILSVDYRCFEASNSGIKYYITENSKGEISSVGCEYQLIDNDANPDALLADGKRRTAALYDILACTEPTEINKNGFNTALLIVDNGNVQHWLNGKKVLEYVKGGQAWLDGIAQSKFKGNASFAATDEGYILLQDHHSKMEFKNIKILETK